MINLAHNELQEVKQILAEHAPGYEVWAFGSRVDGTNKQYSDLDIAIVGQNKIDWKFLERLKDEFSASNLPFMVDIVDFLSLDTGLAGAIKKNHEVIQVGK